MPVREVADGVVIRVAVRPRAAQDAILGVQGGALRVTVRAAPERGRANQAVLRLLASALGVPTGDVELQVGHRGRHKQVRVRGLTVEEARSRLLG